ncbi:MAG: hypothetical protein PHD15_02890 [Clostridia bacterium]|nr:hypothetical protein [Clostridia bacterium]MDD4386691.1 hypothetical protein [Clostridia bacterium]
MKSKKRRSFFKSFIIIILILLLVSVSIYILFNTQLFKKYNKQNNSNVEFKLPFEEKEYKNLLGYDFYTKENGTVLIKSSGLEMVNIYSEGTIININERVVKIEVFELIEENRTPSNVLMLTENGNLYICDLGQTVLDNTNIYKYTFNQKIKDIKLEVIQSILYHEITVVELENGETRVVGPRNILLAPINYFIGKRCEILSLGKNYILIENDNKIRIGDVNKDKYFSILEEKWINADTDITNYIYLKDETDKVILAKDFKCSIEGDVTNVYILTNDNKLFYLSVSDKSLLKVDNVLEKYEIKLSKIASEFVSNELSSIVTIKFTDGTVANIKGNNLIFGMLSENNNFFTFSKQYLKDNIKYKILTDKSGINYKIKDYQIIYDVIEDSDFYIINVFMITEDNNMIMTRLSNNQQYNYIDIMKVENIDSKKLIDKFDCQYSEDDGYTTKIVFKDGTKVDFYTFIKKYLLLS